MTGGPPGSAPDKEPGSEALAQLSGRVREALGLDYPPARHADLWRGLQRAAAERGQSAPRFCAELLAAPEPAALQSLARVLTVGETYLFREPRTLMAIAGQALPDVIERRRDTRRLRLWSAACCSGEEAYMLAILALQCVPDPQAWDIQVLGTDLNDRFLDRARHGRYGAWSFREAPLWLKAGYFERTDDGLLAPVAAIRERVSCARPNLVDSADRGWPGDASIDVALCRNVLMYFSPEASHAALARLVTAIAPGGWVAVGSCEWPLVRAAGLQPVSFGETIL